ncbi:cytochrome ubiquinol oxidase subunit I [Lysobacter humi (ex Lee et al. 2017)]
MDALLLSRIQFGFVISFHIIFPAFTIGLASWLAFCKWRFLKTRDGVWQDIYFFWLRIFAISFGMGVVSGVVMSFQFGTNWAVLSEKAGNILGPVMSYEVLTAFFLEATFLGVMLFGHRRVSEKMHFFATCMVALGTLISMFWILSANSWMHTPQGYTIAPDGTFHPADWWAIVFNPSFPYRLAHMGLAAFITTCLVVGGVSAGYLLRGVHVEPAKKMLRMAALFAAITVPTQILVGDLHGLQVGEYQPTKLAAIEGHWEAAKPGEGMPLVLFGLPNQAAERNDYEVKLPRLGSIILTHTWDGDIRNLKSVPREDRPPVAPVFWSFRVMVGLGMLMLLMAAWSAWALRKGRLFESRILLRFWRTMMFSGFIALLAGWYVVEIGRQPWVIYGLLRTADAVSPTVAASSVIASLAAFGLVYAIVFGAGIWYLVKLVKKGPLPHDPGPKADEGERRPKRPLSVGTPFDGEDIREAR